MSMSPATAAAVAHSSTVESRTLTAAVVAHLAARYTLRQDSSGDLNDGNTNSQGHTKLIVAAVLPVEFGR
jgi:hypothetical protein